MKLVVMITIKLKLIEFYPRARLLSQCTMRANSRRISRLSGVERRDRPGWTGIKREKSIKPGTEEEDQIRALTKEQERRPLDLSSDLLGPPRTASKNQEQKKQPYSL